MDKFRKFEETLEGSVKEGESRFQSCPNILTFILIYFDVPLNDLAGICPKTTPFSERKFSPRRRRDFARLRLPPSVEENHRHV